MASSLARPRAAAGLERWPVAVVALLVVVAGATGILAPRVYRDEVAVVRDGWIVNDAVTLLVAVPLLLLALAATERGSLRGRLVLVGALHYVLYDYGFYLFGAALNALFLVYAAIVALAGWALVAVLHGTDAPRVARSAERAPARPVAAWMLFVAVGLATTWVAQWYVALHRTAPPGRFDLTPDFVRVVASFDLTLMVGLLVPSAVWLWRGRPWGFVLAPALLVSGAVYQVVLAGGSVLQARAGMAGAWPMFALWTFLGVGCAAAAGALLRRVH